MEAPLPARAGRGADRRCRQAEHSKPIHVQHGRDDWRLCWRKCNMLAPSSGLLRAGLALKLGQIKLATRSYLRDRTNQTIGSITSYAIAAGLLAAAGIFLIAACLVGTAALFRWIELHYGLFQAFGAVAALLLV